MGGGVRAHDRAAGTELAGLVLVDVVAEEEEGVQVAAGGEVAVGGEVAGLPVGAGRDAEAQAGEGGVGGRGGVGAADRGGGATGGEAVPVEGVRGQAADVGLDGVVGGGGGGHRAARRDPGEALVGGELPADLGVGAGGGAGDGVGGRGDPGPEQDAVGERVAGGDPVEELGGGRGRGRRAERERQGGGAGHDRGGLQHLAAVRAGSSHVIDKVSHGRQATGQ